MIDLITVVVLLAPVVYLFWRFVKLLNLLIKYLEQRTK